MDLSITLPKYAYKPSVYLVYDDGLSHTRGNMAILVTEDIELAPTRDNAVAFLHKHVPVQFHDTVSYVGFIADQLIPKLQYSQAYLSDAGDLVMHVETYSYEQVDIVLKKGVAGKMVKRSCRTGANGEAHEKYFYVW